MKRRVLVAALAAGSLVLAACGSDDTAEPVEDTTATTEAAPETAYEFTMPEGVEIDPATLGNLTELSKELGLTKEQAQKVADLGAQEAGKSFRIRHALPKEGAVLALDALVIAKDAPRPDLAYQFINFMLDGQNSAELTNMLGTGNPNAAAMNFITPDIKAMKAVFPDEQAAKTLEMLKPMNKDERAMLNRIWTEIKAQ